MRSPRVTRWWMAVPLAAWLASSAILLIALASTGELRSAHEPAQLYDSGTRAALEGDLPRAVLDLRRAQRISPGLIPVAGSLSSRIDANLIEVRARVAATPLVSEAGSDTTPKPATAQPRLTSDRLLAAVRWVPTPLRNAAAAILIALLIAAAATRSFCVAAGGAGGGGAEGRGRTRPGALAVSLIVLAAATVCSFAAIDHIVDSRHVEAVLLRPEVPRTGPDDLIYPPAAVSSFPAGTELELVGRSDDGRWLRVMRRTAGSAAAVGGIGSAGGGGGAGGVWLPASSIERINTTGWSLLSTN